RSIRRGRARPADPLAGARRRHHPRGHRGVPPVDGARCIACASGCAAASSIADFWHPEITMMEFQDILFEKRDGVATITINRPKVLNAFRAETVEEMLSAMRDAEDDRAIGVIVLAGVGDRAFCSGGDNSARASGAEGEGGYGGRRLGG